MATLVDTATLGKIAKTKATRILFIDATNKIASSTSPTYRGLPKKCSY